jgi:small subunit ribosomal protein S8e
VKLGTERGNLKELAETGKYSCWELGFIIQNSGKAQKFEIKCPETPSNRFRARQNVITKGTIIETEAGKVKITNRPTQQGMINGILIK